MFTRFIDRLLTFDRLRARLSITDAEHDACLRDTSYGIDLSAFAGKDRSVRIPRLLLFLFSI
jgi:hypothetical protein